MEITGNPYLDEQIWEYVHNLNFKKTLKRIRTYGKIINECWLNKSCKNIAEYRCRRQDYMAAKIKMAVIELLNSTSSLTDEESDDLFKIIHTQMTMAYMGKYQMFPQIASAYMRKYRKKLMFIFHY